jgi:hypothetical protein
MNTYTLASPYSMADSSLSAVNIRKRQSARIRMSMSIHMRQEYPLTFSSGREQEPNRLFFWDGRRKEVDQGSEEILCLPSLPQVAGDSREGLGYSWQDVQQLWVTLQSAYPSQALYQERGQRRYLARFGRALSSLPSSPSWFTDSRGAQGFRGCADTAQGGTPKKPKAPSSEANTGEARKVDCTGAGTCNGEGFGPSTSQNSTASSSSVGQWYRLETRPLVFSEDRVLGAVRVADPTIDQTQRRTIRCNMVQKSMLWYPPTWSLLPSASDSRVARPTGWAVKVPGSLVCARRSERDALCESTGPTPCYGGAEPHSSRLPRAGQWGSHTISQRLVA